MIEDPPNTNYLNQFPREGAASPTSVADGSLSTKPAISSGDEAFIEAPQKCFNNDLKINIDGRKPEEKEANGIVRRAFQKELQNTFGPILTEYLYSKENHEKMLEIGAPLMPQKAAEIKKKGEEMSTALVEYCKKSLSDEAKKSSEPDLLDQAMIRYAEQQEKAIASQQGGGIMDFLPHAARVVGGGAMAAFAVASMGHLTPTDIFFLVDLLSSKKLSKGLENFITARLIQHIEFHLESYLQERAQSNNPLSAAEEAQLREMLTGEARSFSHESAYPSAKSGAIHTAALGMGLASVHTPLDALKVIFQGETFDTGAHNQLFRQGVTTVIENIKKIQDSMSATEASAKELSKIKKAIDTVCQRATVAAEEGTGIRRDGEGVKAKTVPQAKKQSALPPPWRRGI